MFLFVMKNQLWFLGRITGNSKHHSGIWLSVILLNCDCCYVLHSLHVTHGNTVMPIILRTSYGTHLLDHLAADGAGLTGGQVTVVTVGQIDANLPWCTYYIVNSSDNSDSVGVALPGSNSRTGSLTISPMNL